MRALIDTRCENGHVHRDVWAEIGFGPGRSLALCCYECGGMVFRADAPAITPNGIPADREFDVDRPPVVNTKTIAEATAKEIEEKWNRFSDPKAAEENVGREVDAHIHDPLPETPDLSFDISRVTDLKTGAQRIETANMDSVGI